MKKNLLILSLCFLTALYSNILASCNEDKYEEELLIGDTNEISSLMQNATVISSYDYTYAFGISQMVIIGDKAYVNFGANKNKLDGDAVNNNNEFCCSEVNLHDMSVNTLTPKVASKKYADGSDAPSNSIIGYPTYTPTVNGQIATFALMRFRDNNPYYCYVFVNPSEQLYNYETCILQYIDTNGNMHKVDFSINNYRQMLLDIGYVYSYIESSSDAYDNINLHYDKNSCNYYVVVSTNSSNTNLPLVLLQSTDMVTWSPCVNIGSAYGANEISAILKDKIINICYRTYKNGMRWLIYDISNKKTLDEGRFEECRNVLSKPDVFTYRNDVYMAVNVYPSIYGTNYKLDPYTIRQEINIYKIVNGKPEFFRKIYNPDGINYFSFCESPEGKLYMAFSEDRRHLYKRLFSNISFVDVTELFFEK